MQVRDRRRKRLSKIFHGREKKITMPIFRTTQMESCQGAFNRGSRKFWRMSEGAAGWLRVHCESCVMYRVFCVVCIALVNATTLHKIHVARIVLNESVMCACVAAVHILLRGRGHVLVYIFLYWYKLFCLYIQRFCFGFKDSHVLVYSCLHTMTRGPQRAAFRPTQGGRRGEGK